MDIACPYEYLAPVPHVGVDHLAMRFAGSFNQKADLAVIIDGKPILVVEMKRPAVLKSSVDLFIPPLYPLGEKVGGLLKPEPPTEDVVRFEGVHQLFGYMVRLNLAWRILSSFDVTYVAHCLRETGNMLFISEGIASTDSRFLGLLAYMLQKAITEPRDFKMVGMNCGIGFHYDFIYY